YNGWGILDTLRRLAQLRVGERRWHRSFLIWRPRRRLTILLKNFGLCRAVRARLLYRSRPTCAWWLDFGEARAVARLGRDWQARSPLRRGSHNPVEFFLGANVGRQFADNFIVHMEHHRIAGGLKADQSFNKKIACNGLHCVLNPSAAISALPIPAINKLTFRVVLEDDCGLRIHVVENKPRRRVSEIAPTREAHAQKHFAVIGEAYAPTGNGHAGLLHRPYRRTRQHLPKLDCPRMLIAPAVFEFLDFFVS